jgi:hypothetical protein
MRPENDSVIIAGSESDDDRSSMSDSSDVSISNRYNMDANPWHIDSWTIGEIDEIEEEFRDSDKTNNHYYIGFEYKNKPMDSFILSVAVSAKTFLNYSYYDVWNYLSGYHRIHPDYMFEQYIQGIPNGRLFYERPKINIMKLQIMPCGTYSVSIKTHWIRLVQRHWIKQFNKRKQMLRRRRSPPEVRYREIHGKYAPYLRNLPGLQGMLSDYA